jgi:hypothetical protein
MGGGGFLGLGPAPKAPAPPDYAGAARETAQGNLEAAQAATAANRVNQITPYGNLNYAETGTDSRGNPIWTATQTLSPAQQQILDMQNQASIGLGGSINAQLGQVNQVMGQGFNPNLPNINFQGGGQTNFTRAGQAPNLQTSLGENVGMEGWDRASNLLMQRLDPQLQRQQERQDAQLAAQGIPIGSEAYTRAKQDLAMQQNDARTQAQLQAQGIQQNLFGQELQAGQFGNQAMLGQNTAQLQNLGFNNQQIQQLFANQMANANFGNTAQQQAFNQALTEYNLPLNTLSALRTGAQVQNPSFVNAPQQATTSGADILGASQMGYNAQMGNFNAQQAAQQNFNQGLMSLGGAGIMAFSDMRLKQNINQIGTLPNGLPFYSFEYIDAVKDHPLAGEGTHIGVMAQEVEQVYPNAVTTLDDGYKVVNYGLLP